MLLENIILEHSLPWLAILCFLVSCFYSKKKYKHFASPIMLFSFGWLLPAIFTYLYGLYDRLWKIKQVYTWFIILYTYFAFCISNILFISFFGSPRGKIILYNVWDRYRFQKVITFLFLFSLSSTIINLVRVFGTLNLISIISTYMQGFRVVEHLWAGNPVLNYFFFTNGLVVILSSIYLCTYGKEKKIVYYLILSFVMLLFLPIKSSLIQPLCVSLIISLLFGLKIDFFKIFIGILFLVSLIIGIDFGRALYGIETCGVSFKEIFFNIPSKVPLYLVQEFPNFELELIHRDLIYGASTKGLLTCAQLLDLVCFFLFGHRLIKRGDPNTSVVGGISYYLVKEGYNIGTFQREIFLDFGIIGILLSPLILGFISAYFYSKLYRKKDIFYLVLYGYIGAVLLFSFWNLDLFEVRYLWWLFLVFIIKTLYSYKKTNGYEKNSFYFSF